MEGHRIMAETKPAEQSAGQKTETKTEAPKAEASKPQPRQGNSGQDQDPGEGVAAAQRAAFTARTTVPGHEGIDARLDNRAGRFRPPLEEWPAKPQQVDGPDLAGQVEHTAATLRDLEQGLGDRKGQYSIGAHGLGRDASLREGRAVSGPDEN